MAVGGRHAEHMTRAVIGTLLLFLVTTPWPSANACSFLATTQRITNLEYVNYFLQFRGPDYTGFLPNHAGAGFDFVHNLLHQTGAMTKQPFVSTDGKTVALFNGEIYNYKDLEATLRPNGPPYTSDGQCVLEAYARWGDAFPDRLDGEFAIAVFDLAARVIVVTTDQFAIKPLWLALPQQSGGVSSSSFGVSSYRSALVRAGHPEDAIRQLDANTVLSFEFQRAAGPRSAPTNFRRTRRHAPVQWDVRQHKTTTDDWERAFEAAVAKRVRGAIHPLYLPLSSGYDSGAVHLAMHRLGVRHATY